MPAELDINKEAVRVSVIALGPRETARQMGLNPNTVLQWTSRYGWLEHARKEPQKPISMQKQPVIGVINPAEALQKVLSERGEHTKLGLSLYAARASRAASKLSKSLLLEAAPSVKAVADVAARVWPETGSTQQQLVAFFSLSAPATTERPILDLPADPMDDAMF